jgi:shikimate dehydrogenase
MGALDGKTKLLCVIGNPVEHSLSPFLHNSFASFHGLNYCYLAFQVSDCSSFFQSARCLGIRGFNVTMPFKRDALECSDEADGAAREAGAANAVVMGEGGRFTAHNTDGAAAVASIKGAGRPIKGARVLLLGKGGAASSAASALSREGALVRLAVRSTAGLASPPWKNAEWMPFSSLSEGMAEADILINATPLGMQGHEGFASFGFLDRAKAGALVFDMVYNPIQTGLAKEARARGLGVLGGLDMLLGQAAASFALFTGQSPAEECLKPLRTELGQLFGGGPG